jgi:poly(3-hydroxyalkanoate) synthetase
VVGDAPVYLSDITCDCYLYAGDDDKITHPRQVFDMENVVSSKNVYKNTFKKAGHTKVFVGTAELKYFANEFLGNEGGHK